LQLVCLKNQGVKMNERRPRDLPHQTDNLVITCIDHRFHESVREILKEEYQVDIDHSDRLSEAGSSKAVADGLLVPSIRTSHRLHAIKNVYIVDHIDCGGFGGLKAFNSDEQRETEAHFHSQSRATNAINKILPQLVITSFVVNMNGESLKPDTP
jgi:carbonic anhydrase